MEFQVYLHSENRRGIVTTVTADSAIEAAFAAHVKRGMPDRPTIECLPDSQYRVNGNLTSVMELT